MSALSKMNSSRAHATSQAIPYDDLREKVAALFRPDRSASAGVAPVPLRPKAEDAARPSLVRQNRMETPANELGSAVDILSRATSYFDFLTQKLDHVENERDEAVLQVEEHKRAISTWQDMIETAQARMRDAERDLSGMRQDVALHSERADAAEDRSKELEDTLKLQDRRMGELERSYNSLHEQVMASFGLESPTYRTLEALVDRFRGTNA